MIRLCLVGLLGLGGLLVAAPAQAQWGTLKGQVILDGDVPELKPLIRKGDTTAKDPEVCAKQDMPNDALAIDKDSKGIGNIAVWLVKKPAKIHPNLAKPAAPTVLFDQVGCRFTPHVLVVHAGQSVQVVSGDGISHNTRGAPIKNQGFNFLVAANDRKGTDVAMPLGEKLPTPITCDIHNWMRAYWLVLDHPYAAVTDKEGKFEIKDLPAGDHEFKVWHETPGYVYKDSKDPKKGLIVKIEADKTLEVPPIKVKLATLEAKK